MTLPQFLIVRKLKIRLLLWLPLFFLASQAKAQGPVLWQIGSADNSTGGMALAPADYAHFLDKDFGWEDRFYLVGYSSPEKDWPCVLPGPVDGWGGTGPTAGTRTNVLNIFFGLANKPKPGKWKLVLDLYDTYDSLPPLLKITVNGRAFKFRLPAGGNVLGNASMKAKEHVVELKLQPGDLREGGNEIQLTVLEGSWLAFDQVRLESPSKTELVRPQGIFVRSVKPATYEVDDNGRRAQPLIVDLEHLQGKPHLTVKLDGAAILDETIETGRYQLEAPMPAVTSSRESRYEVLVDDRVVAAGTVLRTPQRLTSPADYVDTRMGTAHSRWMIAPGPWMPFSMVKLSPDNQNSGWSAGYDPAIESIGAFSHIHEWTMTALGMLPVNGPLKIKVGGQYSVGKGYRSQIDKATEEAPLGYYKVMLTDYNIQAELTATTRCGFQRYTFPKRTDSRVMIDLQTPAEYSYDLREVNVRQVSDYRIEGSSHQNTPHTWGMGIDQEYTVHFVLEFDQPIKKFGTWINDAVQWDKTLAGVDVKDAGVFVEFDTRNNAVVQVRSGLSLVSVENAALNLQEEIVKPFGWDFNAVRNQQTRTWNDLLTRVNITTRDRREKMRFYTNMYRALCSRNTWSDVDGRWVDASETVRQFKDKHDVALGCDAFWNTFWNLNQFWNLVTPEWSSRWVKSQLAMYDAGGWLAKGPAGMEYIPVMVAEHEIPLIISAYQMGIRDYDVEKSFEAVVKMQTTLPQRVGGGYAGNNDLGVYLHYQYVPYDTGRFSNSLEYAYDDWTVSQFAKALKKQDRYKEFADRGTWWKHTIDPESGYARLKGADGKWAPDFDPFKSGANHHYVEGNAWQLTFFVPQDVPGLAQAIGRERFIDRLGWGFGESYKLRFNAPGDQYWDYPVIQGNQQSMHFAFLFNWVKKPWLTQQWSRAIIDRYYGFDVSNAYLGDEDQGQMSAWFVMSALGLFQTDGGCRVDPIYEIGSPIFRQVTIDLGGRYGRGKTFTIDAPNVSRENKYVQRATLNGRELNACWFPASELLQGGKLVLEMGPKPNTAWGLESPEAAH